MKREKKKEIDPILKLPPIQNKRGGNKNKKKLELKKRRKEKIKNQTKPNKNQSTGIVVYWTSVGSLFEKAN